MSIQAVLSVTQLSLIFSDSQHFYNVLITVGQISALLIPVWFTDENRNGEADIFEKEVTVTVKSDSPIEVTTKTEHNPES